MADALDAAIAAKAGKDTVTANADGLMNKEDKVKLDGIAAGANNYAHPSFTAVGFGLYRITVSGISGSDTIYGNASASAACLTSLDETPNISFGIAYPANASAGS